MRVRVGCHGPKWKDNKKNENLIIEYNILKWASERAQRRAIGRGFIFGRTGSDGDVRRDGKSILECDRTGGGN